MLTGNLTSPQQGLMMLRSTSPSVKSSPLYPGALSFLPQRSRDGLQCVYGCNHMSINRFQDNSFLISHCTYQEEEIGDFVQGYIGALQRIPQVSAPFAVPHPHISNSIPFSSKLKKITLQCWADAMVHGRLTRF